MNLIKLEILTDSTARGLQNKVNAKLKLNSELRNVQITHNHKVKWREELTNQNGSVKTESYFENEYMAVLKYYDLS